MNRRRYKIMLDVALTLLLGVQMAYSLISEVSHEITGLCMLALLVLHHVLNGGFHSHLFKGKYSPYRAGLTIIDALMLVIFLTQGLSGLMMAKHIHLFDVTAPDWARKAHLFGAYWGFALCGIHAGMHMIGLYRKHKKPVVIVGIVAVILGGWAFVHRGLPGYMTLRQQFVFFDYSEPLILFFADYALILLAIMALGCGLGLLLQRANRRNTI